MWSCLNLHGAGANNSKTPRISLRYKIRSNSFKSKTNLIDKLFEKVSGPKFLKKARTDVNEKNFREVKFRQKNESILLGKTWLRIKNSDFLCLKSDRASMKIVNFFKTKNYLV